MGVIRILLSLLLFLFGCKSEEPTNSDNNNLELPVINTIGEKDKIEIVTWNIEQFPKMDHTDDYVKTIIEGLDADIYVLQEIRSENQFSQMLGTMNSYNYILHKNRTGLGLAIIYKEGVVQVKNVTDLFENNDHFFAGRPPLLTKLQWQVNGIAIDLVIINVHFKCCGDDSIEISNDDDEEYRRYQACQLLYNFVADSLNRDNIIIAGDWNDAIQEPVATNIFQSFIDDMNNFRFADMEIARGESANWSWQGWESTYPAIHFDHILINRLLFDEFENSGEVDVLKLEKYFKEGGSEFDENVSDHRPVLLKFSPG